MRPVRILVEESRYSRLERVAEEQNLSVEDLLSRRGVDLVLNQLEADLPRAAAALVATLNFNDLGKLSAIIQALHALQAALPPRGP